jgi:hypothetical protein
MGMDAIETLNRFENGARFSNIGTRKLNSAVRKALELRTESAYLSLANAIRAGAMEVIKPKIMVEMIDQLARAASRNNGAKSALLAVIEESSNSLDPKDMNPWIRLHEASRVSRIGFDKGWFNWYESEFYLKDYLNGLVVDLIHQYSHEANEVLCAIFTNPIANKVSPHLIEKGLIVFLTPSGDIEKRRGGQRGIDLFAKFCQKMREMDYGESPITRMGQAGKLKNCVSWAQYCDATSGNLFIDAVVAHGAATYLNAKLVRDRTMELAQEDSPGFAFSELFKEVLVRDGVGYLVATSQDSQGNKLIGYYLRDEENPEKSKLIAIGTDQRIFGGDDPIAAVEKHFGIHSNEDAAAIDSRSSEAIDAIVKPSNVPNKATIVRQLDEVTQKSLA